LENELVLITVIKSIQYYSLRSNIILPSTTSSSKWSLPFKIDFCSIIRNIIATDRASEPCTFRRH